MLLNLGSFKKSLASISDLEFSTLVLMSLLTSSGRREKKTINKEHYGLPATPNSSAHTEIVNSFAAEKYTTYPEQLGRGELFKRPWTLCEQCEQYKTKYSKCPLLRLT